MHRPFIVLSFGKWYVFVGSKIVAICESKEEATLVKREYIQQNHNGE